MIQIKLRELQHFLYCAHRWGLIEIDQAWAENAFVVRGNQLHTRVHDPEKAYTQRGKRVMTGVQVYLDTPDYGLYGVVDCLEATPDPGGVRLRDGKPYKLCVVEYKPSLPKGRPYNEEDALQVFAQKLCVDAVFGCRCEAVLYYAKEKQRVALPFEQAYDQYAAKLREAVEKIVDYKTRGVIPPIQKGQNCNGCSMKDLCIPVRDKGGSVRDRIHTALADETI